MRNPRVLPLIMDSLRYWVLDMHVDGFRFDLASTLARELHEVDRLSAFFDIIHQDPVLSRIKLIAEPWDLGEGGYQVRDRRKRSFLATLMFSQGVPMLLGGDELGHTQKGNNNAYCQDNEITWLNWDSSERQKDLLRFTRGVIRLRREQPVFRRRRFFHGKPIEGSGCPDIAWLNVDGSEMTAETWTQGWVKCLGAVLFGDSIDVDEYGEEIHGDTLLLLFNAASGRVIPFTLPQLDEPQPWELLLDTAHPQRSQAHFPAGEPYPLQPFTVALFRLCTPTDQRTV
jgi:glycogen operon protein